MDQTSAIAFALPAIGVIVAKAVNSGLKDHIKGGHQQVNVEDENLEGKLSRRNTQVSKKPERLSKEENLKLRMKHLGPNCQMFFKQNPLKIDFARGQYMYDENGTRYIDCINNVAHVGHSHPRVTEAAIDQMQSLYTNNRYLHDNIVNLAKRITDTFPEQLSVCYFTNSGSEANDLALQMARIYSKEKDVIYLEHAYHGTVMSVMEVNPYKWMQTDLETSSLYRVPWAHQVPLPDRYRGKYRDNAYTEEELTDLYVEEVRKVIRKLQEEGRRPAAFIAESMQSCGGQVSYPKRYLELVSREMKKCGGLVIADEVQVGFGRVGDNWWAFQQYESDFLPDIVTIGKPMGNGHPVAAVVTTRDVADNFKLPYFNTYGGNPVSCAIALSVLDIIESEGLRKHAKEVGNHLMTRLKQLSLKHECIGDVRGHGLFVGMDLVTDRTTREPATDLAGHMITCLRHDGVILSKDGPHENVIKFKPPMCITTKDMDEVCAKIDQILIEVKQNTPS